MRIGLAFAFILVATPALSGQVNCYNLYGYHTDCYTSDPTPQSPAPMVDYDPARHSWNGSAGFNDTTPPRKMWWDHERD